MNESKFNSAFETTLHDLELKRQTEAKEVENLRIANGPAEREKAEATVWLQSEMLGLGMLFVTKAKELGVKPTSITRFAAGPGEHMGWDIPALGMSGDVAIDKNICRILVFKNGSIQEDVAIKPKSEWPEGYYHRTNHKGALKLMDENARRGFKDREYRFSANMNEEVQEVVDYYAVVMGEALAKLASEK